jgi:NodT family efflux transporter outer membrane factor (OMF) lipoprotein
MASVTPCAPITQVLLLGCFLTIAACTTIPVQHHSDIQAGLPDQFAGKGAVTSNSRLFWEQSFLSEPLQADVRTLLGENFELEAARARVEQAAAAYGIAGSVFMPSLDGKADFEREREKKDEKGSITTTQSTISFGGALNWEPDIWGRLKARREAAALSLEEQQALADQTALDLQALLVESWITHHAARKLEQVFLEQKETNAQLLYLTELRLAQGQGNALDVLQQRGRLVTVERALPSATSTRRRAANAYAVLMGFFPDGGDLPEDEWPTLERLSAITTPRQLLMDRPDLRAAFLALQAADYEVAAAIADRLPSLSIGLSYEVSGSGLSKIGHGSVLSFASGLLAPVFDAGRLKAKAAQRKAEARESLAVLEQAVLTAIREVEDALIRERLLFDEQRLLRIEIAIARDTVAKARLRYINGQESYLAVLTSLTELQALQQNEITLQQEMLINRGRLLKALGAKWSDYCETP